CTPQFLRPHCPGQEALSCLAESSLSRGPGASLRGRTLFIPFYAVSPPPRCTQYIALPRGYDDSELESRGLPAGDRVVEPGLMGRVLTEVTIENLGDLFEASRGLRSADQVRRITVPDALVDTGATGLALPTRFIRQLGLEKLYEKRAT